MVKKGQDAVDEDGLGRKEEEERRRNSRSQRRLDREEVEDRLKKGISNVLKKLPMEGSGIKKIKIVEEDDSNDLEGQIVGENFGERQKRRGSNKGQDHGEKKGGKRVKNRLESKEHDLGSVGKITTPNTTKLSDENDAEEQTEEEEEEDQETEGNEATTKGGEFNNKNRQSQKGSDKEKEIGKLLDEIRGGEADTEEKEEAVEKLAKMTGIKIKRRKRRVKRVANGYRRRMRYDGFLNDGFGWDGQEDGKIRNRKTGGEGKKEEGGFTLHYATFKEGSLAKTQVLLKNRIASNGKMGERSRFLDKSSFIPRHEEEIRSAIVVFNATSGNPTGFFQLSQASDDANVRVTGTVRGLSDGAHGLAITFFGEESLNCENYGPHYNAISYGDHGGPDSQDGARHLGDLGNIQSSGGTARVDREFSHISLQGPKSIIGRGMVITDRQDNLGQASDEVSMRNGRSGIALQCGVVAVAR